jgi:hypothetical protein
MLHCNGITRSLLVLTLNQLPEAGEIFFISQTISVKVTLVKWEIVFQEYGFTA